jgi:hypothetical protein
MPRNPHRLAHRVVLPSVGRNAWAVRPQLRCRHRRRRDGCSPRAGRRLCLIHERHGRGRSRLGWDGRGLRPTRRRFGARDPRLDRRRRARRLDRLRARPERGSSRLRRVRNRIHSRRGFGRGFWRGSRRRRLAGAGGVRNRRSSRLGRRRWRRRDARRQQGQRIDVALRIARHARPEIHVRLRQLDRAARPDTTHNRRFSHERAARHADRAEVDERGRVSKRRLDRNRLSAGWHRPGKGHHALRGGEHRAAARSA